VLPLHRDFKDNNLKERKKVMVTLMTFAIVAVMVAQAINLSGKLR